MASLGVVFAAAYLSAVTLFPRAPHGRIVDGDTIQYYAYLRSLAIDHDLDFSNDYQLLYAPASEDAAVCLASGVEMAQWLLTQTSSNGARNTPAKLAAS